MKRAILALFACLALFGAGAAPAKAHEVRPAYLEIDQTGLRTYTILWKQPTLGDVAIHLEPHLSNGWLDKPASDQYAAAGFLIRTWTISARSDETLSGQTVTIEGLEDTITDVFVRVRLKGGQRLDAIVRPETPHLTISLRDRQSLGLSDFLKLGVEHILTGPDHLLFVLGLLLIVQDRWMLLKTVSAFTLAHSLTLAGASFGVISLSPSLLNTLIALSILFLAPEIVRAQRGQTSFTLRYPWVVAFAFGLLHGLGFASGLTALGLDKVSLLSALVLFNVGVEIGQLSFIALVLALNRAFRLMEIKWHAPIALAPSYLIGGMGAYWTFQYAAALFSWPP